MCGGTRFSFRPPQPQPQQAGGEDGADLAQVRRELRVFERDRDAGGMHSL
jgi:hypothetical protein